MSQVLFVMRGQRDTQSDDCFAFTTCHGDSLENLIFPCHTFRCELNEAVSKILYSFWTVFKRQQLLNKQQEHQSSECGRLVRLFSFPCRQLATTACRSKVRRGVR
jgi:hypothetical protein